MIKKFLVPVLALFGFGFSAQADVTEYCNPSGNCGSNTTTAFETAVTNDSYTYASLTDITFASGGLSGSQYLDPMTQVLFAASSALAISGVTLVETAENNITITVPATYAAIRFSVSQLGAAGSAFTGIDANSNYYVFLTSTPQEIGFINQTPGSPWTITLVPGLSGEKIQFDSFDAAGAAAPTPEVGTLLLIGSGLIAMRYMKRRRASLAPKRFFRGLQTA
jgi:hypothetical protein